MRILVLESYRRKGGSPLRNILGKMGHKTHPWTLKPEKLRGRAEMFDLAVSDGYCYKIPPDILKLFKRPPVNVHLGVLPLNRGVLPNLFAWYEDLPHGWTIHEMTDRVDSGPAIAWGLVEWLDTSDLTLRQTWERLHHRAMEGFKRHWLQIRYRATVCGRATMDPAPGRLHTGKEADALLARLPKGWDTPVEEVRCLTRKT